jgi:hypothetical protein
MSWSALRLLALFNYRIIMKAPFAELSTPFLFFINILFWGLLSGLECALSIGQVQSWS